MPKLHISKLIPGMVLEADVYNESDQLILPEGLKLNDKTIAKLTYYGIMSVRIKEDENIAATLEAEPPKEEVSEMGESYSERLKQTEEFKVFAEKFENTVEELQGFLSDVVEKNLPPDTTAIVDKITEMLHPADGTLINVFDMMHNMKQFDDMTFTHCLNVGLICNVFGKWLGLGEDEIKLATECGIMHDIGKLKIPENIIKKPDRLTNEEYEIIKTHPVEGYKLLSNADVNEHIKKAALMHHERADGSGYPMGLSNEQIDFYAKMVCVADVYEAMTAVRIYRGSLSPFQVIETFESEGFQKYDTHMIMTFLENIVSTYMLNRVRLSDGREGDIVFVNKQRLSKPTIKTKDGFVDLLKEPDVSIVAIL